MSAVKTRGTLDALKSRTGLESSAALSHSNHAASGGLAEHSRLVAVAPSIKSISAAETAVA